MGFEREDVKSILLMINRGDGRVQFSGFVRQVDNEGVSMMRVSNQNITSVVFDGLEFIEPPSSGEDTEISLTHLNADWSDTTPR